MRSELSYQPGDKIGGRYRVHEGLKGGMGEVYLCLDLEKNYPYALKTFQRQYTGDARLRALFEQEVGTWIALEKHPNIVRCFYQQTVDNRPFMLLEWVAAVEGQGTSLAEWLVRGPLAPQQALDFAIDLCRGLSHAGKKQPGIVHRDLKPDNILVAQGPVAKITDFGLAKVVQDAGLDVEAAGAESGFQLSNQGGTPITMAPEQWRGEPLDARTDLYGVGCVLYEMLAGRAPYAGFTVAALERQHLAGPIPALPADGSVLRELNVVVHRCLEKTREARYPSVEALLEALLVIYGTHFGPPREEPAAEEFTAADYGNGGAAYHALGRHQEALADYGRALALKPDDAMAFNNRGATYAALGRHQEALADYGRALALKPDVAEAFNNRGNTYAALGRHQEALADYGRALALKPDYALAFYNRGNTYRALGRDQEALADYGRALALKPDYALAFTNRGLTYHALGRHQEALADYERALALKPDYALAFYNRGNTYRALGRHQEALADYGRALALKPDYAAAFTNRGNTYADLGRHQEALADYGRALALKPDYALAFTNRGLTYHALGRHQEALADYERALALKPDYALAFYNRGNTHRALGRHQEALADYGRALALKPDYAAAFTNRGNTYADLGRHQEALGDYGRALALKPDFAEAHANLGVLYAQQGALQEALTCFEKAASLGLAPAAQYATQIRQMLND